MKRVVRRVLHGRGLIPALLTDARSDLDLGNLVDVSTP